MSRSDNEKIRENGMLILDCTSEPQENKSEGLLLKELVRILEPKVSPRVIKVRGVSAFKRRLRDSSERLVHVSAHGRYYYKKTTRLNFPSGKWITAKGIRQILTKREETPMLMVFSACSVGNEDIVRSLKEAGVKYLIAPTEDVYWFDAAMFLTIFYRLLLVEARSPWVAYRNSERARKLFFPKLTGIWNFFQDGKLCYSAPYSRNKTGSKICINCFE
ncbi:hypothetical protein GTO27_04885 [Candidatus Bathyarchaeota archaeon]|nr:hypothetical protein [Candidatus Bathyarchaeota archaeon]